MRKNFEDYEKQRWEERYADPLKVDLEFDGDKVKVGDEVFLIKDLEAVHRVKPQHPSHPIKPHHDIVQKSMDELIQFYKDNPVRKDRMVCLKKPQESK